MAITSKYAVIVGIDFGTTRSGYHFAFTATPNEIIPNEDWLHAPPSGKTLTEILLDKKDLSVIAFGFEARHRFAAAKDKDNLAYFSNFKTELHNKGGGVDRSTIKAKNCNMTLPTLDLITICLRVIKNKAIEQLQTSTTVKFDESSIRWVITVPAIWDMPARMVMKNAAVIAGIPQDNIEIALEPEAAVLCCLEREREMKATHVTASTDFVVVDAGGGTVDITVHRNRAGDGLVELHSPSGGMWGSGHINLKFEAILEELLGKANIKNVQGTLAWNSMMDTFEVAKINFSPDYPGGFVSISAIMPNDLSAQDQKTAIEAYNNKYNTTLNIDRGMLYLDTILPMLFAPFVTEIIAHITKLFDDPALEHVKYLFLVGGFAQSLILRRKLEQVFGHRVKVIVPPQPGISVVNGAVRFGFDPSVIKERLMQQTIGIEILAPWNDTIHAGKQQMIGDNNEVFCTEAVFCFTSMGDTIGVNHQVTHPFVPAISKQKQLPIRVIASSKKKIFFSSDEGAKFIGKLLLDIPEVDAPKETRFTDVTMQFGGTTFAVTATYRKTGKTTSAKFDLFLNTDRVGK